MRAQWAKEEREEEEEKKVRIRKAQASFIWE